MIGALVSHLSHESMLVEAESGRRVDGAELARLVEQAAAGLTALGLDSTDRLAILAPQTIDWYLIHLAADRIGLLTVPLNTRYTEPEIIGMLEASDCTAVAVGPTFLGQDFANPVRAAQERPNSRIRTVLTLGTMQVEGWPGLAELSGPALTDKPGESGGLICFGTSGTTSAPKLAVHSRVGVVTHVQAVCHRLGLIPTDTVMALLPPSGAYGYTVALSGLMAGAKVVIVAAFRPGSLGGLIREHSGTFLAVTEPILRSALANDGPDQFATVRLIVTAGATVADLAAYLDAHGVCLVNVYGASEVLAMAAVRRADLTPSERAMPGGCVVADSLSVRVVDDRSGDVHGVGNEGELQFQGPTVFSGYLGLSQATAEAFTEDGWYRTKDRARLDDTTTFSYLSRSADTMRLRGYLVDPAQIEGVLMAHPEVAEAQVVGIPDPASGEDRAVAFVVSTASDSTALPTDLVAWCRGRLARFKVPAHVLVVDEIPLATSANGDKALKRTLRELALKILEGNTT